MASNRPRPEPGKLDQVIAEARRSRKEREKGYRERALKLFPHVCARCGREFEGKRLRELTVHHRDHNHDNNPPDGSNWELLCLYCHDNEHQRMTEAELYGPDASDSGETPAGLDNPFAALKGLIRNKE